MWSFCQLILFWIFSLNSKSVYGSTHVVIGNYSQLNPKDCGINPLTNRLSDMCLKWHKDPISGLTAGRNATYGEVPWMAYIVSSGSYCSGSVIANQWVLTAAHCLKKSTDPKDYSITLGYHSLKSEDRLFKVNATEIHKHTNNPRKIEPATNKSYVEFNDIGLIKMELPISAIRSIKGQRMSTELKSICLPKEDIFNTKPEYAMNAGWGQVDRRIQPVQVGYKLMHTNFTLRMRNQIRTTPTKPYYKLQGSTCKGDSGGPLWQFYSDRAVIIGIAAITDGNPCETTIRQESIFTRVSYHISWIKKMTNLE